MMLVIISIPTIIKLDIMTTAIATAIQAVLFTSSTIGDVQVLTGVPRTFVAFVKVPADYGTGRVGALAGSAGDSNDNDINWEIHGNGKPRLWWNDGQVDWIVNNDVRTGTWVHVAFVVNHAGTDAKCYVDGSLVESKTSTFASVGPNRTMMIGGDHRTGNSQAFKAQLKCVKVFNSELTASDIAQQALDGCQAPTSLSWGQTHSPTEVKVSEDTANNLAN